MFFRKKVNSVPQEWGITLDIHNHILPGIDDGATKIGESATLIQGLKSLGFQHFIPTPHIASGLYLNDSKSISVAMNDVFAAKIANNEQMPAHAAEYMLDDYFIQLLEADLITYPNSNKRYVLVEFSYLGLPVNWHELIFELRRKGYQPILAHPERYQFLPQEMLLQTFTNCGLLYQLNLLSLSGYYGDKVKNLAELLMKEGLYHFAGTDTHHAKHLEALHEMKLNVEVSKLIAEYNFHNSDLLAQPILAL